MNEQELKEARKFKREFGLGVPTLFQKLFMPKVFWLARDGAISVLAEEKYRKDKQGGKDAKN